MAGKGSVDGSIHKAVVQQKEELRRTVLKVALSRMSELNIRPVNAWPNRDKLSSSWLQCLPGPDGMGSQAFSEGIASLLCMPSQACQDRV